MFYHQKVEERCFREYIQDTEIRNTCCFKDDQYWGLGNKEF